MVITEIVPDELIAYDLSFDNGKYQSKGMLIIEAVGDSNKVSWLDEGDLGYNPIYLFMGLYPRSPSSSQETLLESSTASMMILPFD